MINITIYNQDRDELFFGITMIVVKKHYYNDKLMGYNLLGFNKECEEYLLGTFETNEEAFNEMVRLNNDMDPIKHITIYE